MREDSHRSRLSATVTIIIAVTACFLLQEVATFYFRRGNWIAEYLGLSTEGLKRGFIWQLLSFQFLHGGFIHLFFNVLTLWFFGRPVEERLGSHSFLKLYFISGAGGGLLQAGLGLMARNYFGHTTYGASAGICGIIAAFALMEPHAIVRIWGVIPLKAMHLLWIGGGIALFFTLVPSDSGVAHAAHLGGYLAGIAYMRWDSRRPVLNWNPLQGRRRKRQLVQAAAQITRWRVQREKAATDLPPEEFISREVDPILDKISAHGIHSLTPRERQILEAARSKMAKR